MEFLLKKKKKKKKKITELGPLGLGRGGGTNFKWALETLDPNT